MKRTPLFLLFWLISLCSSVLGAEEYKFEPSEIEKKPYHLGGFGEVRPVLNVLDKNAALYKVNFYSQNVGDATKEYNFRLQVEGSYEEGIARFFLRANQDVDNTYQGWDSNGKIYEGFLSLKPSDSYHFDAGKKVFKWGKGMPGTRSPLLTVPRTRMIRIWPWKGFGLFPEITSRVFQVL